MNGYVYVWCRIAANPIDVVVVGQRENVFIYASNTCIIMCTSINNAEHFFFGWFGSVPSQPWNFSFQSFISLIIGRLSDSDRHNTNTFTNNKK